MKIAVYNADANGPGSDYTFHYIFRPLRADEWDRIAAEYPDHEFRVFYVPPCGMVIDDEGDGAKVTPKRVSYEPISIEASVEEFAQKVADWKPDVAIAMTPPSLPYDWNNMRDALVGDELKSLGVNTIAHDGYMGYVTCDKPQTTRHLKAAGFNCADSIHINSWLFSCHKREAAVGKNTYREHKLARIKKMTYPIVIKNTVSAGSLGLSIADTYEEAKRILSDYEGDSDLVVEQWISGDSFGIEIMGVPGAYTVYAPILFSVTDDGVTDPFTSFKMGPVTNPEFKVDKLKAEMVRMAESIGLYGAAEVDLIFHEGEWYIVEINSRMSYLTAATSSMNGKGLFDDYISLAVNKKVDSVTPKYIMDFKTPNLSEDMVETLWKECPILKSIMNTYRKDSIDMCEFVAGGCDTGAELVSELKKMRERFPDIVSERVIDMAEKMVRKVSGE
ncbi:MAG: ATP-grasp domain-containing protein [Lachnospiraceae bacterium]|nr:ATP-grasp domain-containing protein [Lachnospiraceae bacterium]